MFFFYPSRGQKGTESGSATLLYLRVFLSGFRSDGRLPGQAGPQAHQAVRRHQRGRQEALHHLSAGTGRRLCRVIFNLLL